MKQTLFIIGLIALVGCSKTEVPTEIVDVTTNNEQHREFKGGKLDKLKECCTMYYEDGSVRGKCYTANFNCEECIKFYCSVVYPLPVQNQ